MSVADHVKISGGLSAPKRRFGPQSRAIDRGSVGWSIDGRSREGRFLSAYEAMLSQHVGGSPSRVQCELIRRCARLALHLELQDEKLLSGGPPTDHSARHYLAWNNALVRTLRQLGLKSVPIERSLSLSEIVASAAATNPAGAPLGMSAAIPPEAAPPST
jgi:hypothetical protein